MQTCMCPFTAIATHDMGYDTLVKLKIYHSWEIL